MAITAKDEKNYENPKAGLHQAVCAVIHDIGWQQRIFNGHEDFGHQVIVMWELKSETSKGNRFQVSKFYTLSLNQKANLRKDLESWLGRNLTEKEIKEGFDIESMLGKNCFLNLKLEEKNEKTRAVICGISPLMEGVAEIRAMTQETPAWIEKISERGLDEKPQVQAPPEESEHVTEDAEHQDLPF